MGTCTSCSCSCAASSGDKHAAKGARPPEVYGRSDTVFRETRDVIGPGNPYATYTSCPFGTDEDDKMPLLSRLETSAEIDCAADSSDDGRSRCRASRHRSRDTGVTDISSVGTYVFEGVVHSPERGDSFTSTDFLTFDDVDTESSLCPAFVDEIPTPTVPSIASPNNVQIPLLDIGCTSRPKHIRRFSKDFYADNPEKRAAYKGGKGACASASAEAALVALERGKLVAATPESTIYTPSSTDGTSDTSSSCSTTSLVVDTDQVSDIPDGMESSDLGDMIETTTVSYMDPSPAAASTCCDVSMCKIPSSLADATLLSPMS
eukprot:TRINITY_DN33533_c0_g1_i2.p1 TRINITY_DN33533_c0_g1~~TRINITY_DN33533_c0_g1_i2.p1  ORF type:complete len:319 (+),score=59.57 TRINITY_DN33533_c0_g1_i2:144-1100(+)